MFTAQILYQFLLFSGVSSCVVTFSLGLNLAHVTYDSSDYKFLGMCCRFCRCLSLTIHPASPHPRAAHHTGAFCDLPNTKCSSLIKDFKNKSICWAGWWVGNKIKLVFNYLGETQVHILVNTHPCRQDLQVKNQLLWTHVICSTKHWQWPNKFWVASSAFTDVKQIHCFQVCFSLYITFCIPANSFFFMSVPDQFFKLPPRTWLFNTESTLMLFFLFQWPAQVPAPFWYSETPQCL